MKVNLKSAAVLVIAGVFFSIGLYNRDTSPGSSINTDINNKNQTDSLESLLTPISEIEEAFARQLSDISVFVRGPISKILKDDTEGNAHQRFIIELSNGRTILVAHNVDLAPRITGISKGSVVYVHGDYEWNSQGGVIHWTHHDPDGSHENGWIIFDGKKYQ
ncbi:MAG: DUF3465 domain-containing protein [Fibrobacter sp.]|nr:DUF3465 domain-containing protein [Fibrobacter sp.]